MTHFYVRAVYFPFLFISYLIFCDFPDHFCDFIWGKQKGFPKLKRNQARTLMMVCFFLLWVQWNYFLSDPLLHAEDNIVTFQKHSLDSPLCPGWGSKYFRCIPEARNTNFPLQRCEKVSSQDKKLLLFLLPIFFQLDINPKNPIMPSRQCIIHCGKWRIKRSEGQKRWEIFAA